MSAKRIFITALAVAVVLSGLEFFIHGSLLHPIYDRTSHLWRPESDMQKLFWMMILGQVIFSIFFTVIFAKGYEKGKPGLGQGFRFGLWMGLLLAPINALAWYVILPIPAILAFYWFAAGFSEMIILGLVAGIINA